MSRVADAQGSLRRLALYCPSLSHECEERASECVLYYYPPHDSSDARLNFVGFCTAVHLITSRFAPTTSAPSETSCTADQSASHTVGRSGGVVCMYEVRPDLWLALELQGTTQAIRAHALLRQAAALGAWLYGEALWTTGVARPAAEEANSMSLSPPCARETQSTATHIPHEESSSSVRLPSRTPLHKLTGFLDDYVRFLTHYVLREAAVTRRDANSPVALSAAWAHIAFAEAELGYACPLAQRAATMYDAVQLACLQCITRHTAALEPQQQAATDRAASTVSCYTWQALCAAQDPVPPLLLDTATATPQAGASETSVHARNRRVLCAVLEAETLACVVQCTMPSSVLALQRLALLVFGLRESHTCYLDGQMYDCVVRRTLQVIALVLVPRTEQCVRSAGQAAAAAACAQRIAQDITQLLQHQQQQSLHIHDCTDRLSRTPSRTSLCVCHSLSCLQRRRYGKYAAVADKTCWLAWCAAQGQVRMSASCASDSRSAQELRRVLAAAASAKDVHDITVCNKRQTWVHDAAHGGWLCVVHEVAMPCDAWSFAAAFPTELPLRLCFAYAHDLSRMLAV